jgi:hypothetical protein
MSRRVEVLAECDDRDVGLRLREIVEPNRGFYPCHRAIAERPVQEVLQSMD